MNYKDYLKQGIQRSEEKLQDIQDPQKRANATEHLSYLKKAYKKGIPKDKDNSIAMSYDVIEYK